MKRHITLKWAGCLLYVLFSEFHIKMKQTQNECRWGEMNLYLKRNSWRAITRSKCVWRVKAISAHLCHILLRSRFQMLCQWSHSLLISPAAPLMALLWAAHFQAFLNSQVLIFTSRFQAQAERELGAVCPCSRAEVAGTDALINSAEGNKHLSFQGLVWLSEGAQL